MPTTGSQQYEMARAYVAILPSLHGLQKELSSQLQGAMPGFQQTMSTGVNSAMKSSFSGVGKHLLSGTASAMGTLGRTTFNALNTAVGSVGRTFKETMIAGGRAGGTALTAAIGAVGAQVIGGGFSRALGINQAESKLHALGYQGQEFAKIMGNATKAVDGTSYTLQDSIGASGQLLAAGIKPGKELENILGNIGKLTDMSGTRSYGDISSMFGKNAAAGIVQMEDLNQLIDSGVAILPALAKQFGVTALEVRKMSRDGKISFQDFNQAITAMQFDSALYAKENVAAAFKNLRSQLSKLGAELWKPIIEGAGPIFGTLRNAVMNLQKNKGFTDFVNLLQTNLAEIMKKAEDFSKKLEAAFSDQGKVKRFFADLADNFEKFKGTIKGIQGPVAGLGLALTSGLLRNLPLVGGLFSYISPAVGLMGGALYQAWKNSESLQEAVKKLSPTFKGLFKGLEGGLKTDLFKNLGDTLAGVLNSLMEGAGKIDLKAIIESVVGGITRFIQLIQARIPDIVAAFKLVVDAFKGAGTTLAGGEGKDLLATIANGVVEAIQLAAQAISVAIPLVVTVIDAVKTAITSDFTKGVFGFFMSLAKWLTEHKSVFVALAALLAGGFMLKMVLGPLVAFILATGRIIALYNKISMVAAGAAGTATTQFGILLINIFRGLKAAGKMIIASLPEILVGLAGVSALILVIGAVTNLMNEMGFFDILGKVLKIAVDIIRQLLDVILNVVKELVSAIGTVFTMLAGAVTAGWTAIEPILTWLRDSWLLIFQTVGNMVLEAIPLISAAIDAFVKTMMDAAVVATALLDSMIKTLAEHGVAAGAGALAAAGGITALAGALALLGGGSLLHDLASGLGALWSSFVEGVTGEEVSGIGQITALAEAIGGFNGSVGEMPAQWMAVGGQAYGAGYSIMQSFGQGMIESLTTVEQMMTAAILAMLARLQATVYSTPINLNVGNPALAGVAAGSTYNTTTNYDVRVQNDSVLKSLARAAR